MHREHLLTRDHGKIRAVAKGVRRTKSRFGGRLEPFMRVIFNKPIKVETFEVRYLKE